MAELGLVKQAVKVPLVEVLALVKEVHEGVSTVNQELALCPVADLEGPGVVRLVELVL